MTFLLFFRSRRPNRQKAPQMTSQTPSGTLPGTLQEAEIDPLFAPRAFQGRQNECFGTPRAVPEPLRDGSGERLAQGPLRGLQGAILEPCWSISFGSYFGSILGGILDANATKANKQTSKATQASKQSKPSKTKQTSKVKQPQQAKQASTSASYGLPAWSCVADASRAKAKNCPTAARAFRSNASPGNGKRVSTRVKSSSSFLIGGSVRGGGGPAWI